ncbi:GGDEF domain-containing protein [Ideonella azotifigens]|uniref:diguanylate cyclase n=2 Tax=Ideonella azotifigens TaxID=513160 RepID=A0ABN1JHZ0_9BURK|nr:GGDEF domain-containing protein [Ideonella azotifigens]MCD2343552.1 GGDEF domain-containing protein [Ideonella azotifigens]
MTLHIPTLIAALTLGFLLLALQMGLSRPSWRDQPAMACWVAGNWAMVGGFLALIARAWVPLPLSVLIGNLLLCLGAGLFSQAVWVFVTEQPLPLALRWGWLAAALPILAMLDWPLSQRTSVLSLVYAACLLPAVWLVFRHRAAAERSLLMVGTGFALTVLALVCRAWHAWFHPADYQALTQPSLGQGLTFLAAFLTLMTTGWGFLLAGMERTAQRLEVLATHDGLTGCFNRSTADALLQHELQRGQRDELPVAFVLMDLDHFKHINDNHGHRAGDEALRLFAETVRSRLRASDVFCRLGGEEFGLILPATDEAGARRLAEDILQATRLIGLHGADGQPIEVAFSAGLVVAGSDSRCNADHLYRQADAALYAAKRAGRCQIALAQPASS